MADEVALLNEAKKLPLPERVVCNLWKARVAAFEEIIQACGGIHEDSDPRLHDYGTCSALLDWGLTIAAGWWHRVRPGCQTLIPSQSNRGWASDMPLHAGGLFVKAVADSNAAAQDKAVQALNSFLAKAQDVHVSR